MAVILRSTKGSNLTPSEVDGNFTELQTKADQALSDATTKSAAAQAAAIAEIPAAALATPATGLSDASAAAPADTDTILQILGKLWARGKALIGSSGLTMNTGKILGRFSGGAGAIEELTLKTVNGQSLIGSGDVNLGNVSPYDLTYSVAQLEAWVDGVTPTPAPSGLPRDYAASDDLTRTFYCPTSTIAQETTVLSAELEIADVLNLSISNAADTQIFTVDAKGWAGLHFEIVKGSNVAPLVSMKLAYRQTPSDSWQYTHGIGSYFDVDGAVKDDGFLIQVSAPRDPNVLAASERCAVLMRLQGKRYWKCELRMSGASAQTCSAVGIKLVRGF